MRATLAASALALSLFASVQISAKSVSPAMPQMVQGVWFPDDANAAPLCKTYLALKSNADGDARINALVGSVVISRKQIHSVSEYGEGNFYALQSIAATGKGKWKAKTALKLDGDGDDRLASAVPMTLSLIHI